MGELTNPRVIIFKGMLFFILGAICFSLLLLDQPTLRTAVMLCLAIWSFCRSYYFAFYVIEHYVDAEYRFAGLVDCLLYLLGRRRPLR